LELVGDPTWIPFGVLGRPHGVRGETLQSDRFGNLTTNVPANMLGDGRVRQVIETSRDGGKTWRVGFDAIYVRR